MIEICFGELTLRNLILMDEHRELNVSQLQKRNVE